MRIPDEIRRKAEKQRSKEALQGQNNEPANTPDIFRPTSSESFQVFRSINPYKTGLGVWILPVFILAIITWILWLMNQKQLGWLLPVAIAVSLLPVLVNLFSLVRERTSYQTYKNWCSHPGFAVNGWNRLGQTKNFPQLTYWLPLTVEVKLNSGTPVEMAKLTEDVLYLFTVGANRCFYRANQVQSGSSGDLRKKWELTKNFTATGSANGEVMGQLYHCLQKNLYHIHERTNAVEAVNLVFGKTVFEVRPFRLTGLGNT